MGKGQIGPVLLTKIRAHLVCLVINNLYHAAPQQWKCSGNKHRKTETGDTSSTSSQDFWIQMAHGANVSRAVNHNVSAW